MRKPTNRRGGKRPGSGRPKGPKKVLIQTTVLPQTRETIEKTAEQEAKTIGEVIDGLAESLR